MMDLHKDGMSGSMSKVHIFGEISSMWQCSASGQGQNCPRSWERSAAVAITNMMGVWGVSVTAWCVFRGWAKRGSKDVPEGGGVSWKVGASK
jgi:hypothetical protein